MRFFLLFASIFFCVAFGSEAAAGVALKDFYRRVNRTPDMYVSFAEYSLNFKTSGLTGANGSIFAPMMKFVGSRNGTSKDEEYKKFMDALDSVIKSYAISTTLSVRTKRITEAKAKEFLIKMKVVAQEDEFGTDYIKESYQYSPKAIELVISAIEAVEEFLAAPGNCSAPHDVTAKCMELYAEFTKYCKNDAQIRAPIAQMSKLFKIRSNLRFPFIKLNLHFSKLTQTRELDNFLLISYIKNCDTERDALMLAKTIIHGPVTEDTTKVFYTFERPIPIIEALCASQIDRNHLIRRIIASGTQDKFMRVVGSNPSKLVKKFIAELIYQTSNFDAINEFVNFAPRAANNNAARINQLFGTKSQALKEYLVIDRKFVEQSVKAIDEKISFIIDLLKLLRNNAELFKTALILICNYYNLLPEMTIDNFSTRNLDDLLEVLVKHPAGPGALVDGVGTCFTAVMDLSYIRIDFNTIKNTFKIFEWGYGRNDAVEVINQFLGSLFATRDNNEKFELFIEIHKFFEAEGLRSDYFAPTALVKAFSLYDGRLIKQIYDYSVEHRLISKTFLIAAERLVNYSHL